MSTRYSIIRYDSIDYSFWLVFGVDGSMRFSRGQPSVGRGERSMQLSATLPRSLFKAPQLKATINVGEAGGAVDLDVSAAADALKTALGVDVDLRVEHPAGDTQ